MAGVDPPLGDVLGGVALTLTGACLAATRSVTVGGRPCGEVAASDRRVTCVTPALPAGLHDVVAVAGDGVAGGVSLADAFEAWSPADLPGARFYTAAAGVGLEAPPGPIRWWTQTGSAAPWAPRDGAGLVWLGGRVWMLGGWDSAGVPAWGGNVTTNEVWSSPDLGRTWALELPDDHAAADRFGPRHTAGWFTADIGGVTYAYVVGGDIYAVSSDVWRSADGVTWEQVAAGSPWHGRVLQSAGTYRGDLYVMGGQTSLYDPATATSDVWRSPDGGATWERLADAPWAPRGMIYNPVEHDGALWVIGGGTYAAGPRTYHHDVWRFDGETWTEVLPDGAAPWRPREYHNTWAWAGELWVSSGYTEVPGEDGTAGNLSDVWHSQDGVTWTELRGTAMRPGHADGLVVTPHGPVHASGNAFERDTFLLADATGGYVATWADQGVDHVDLVAVPAEAPRLVVGAFGRADGIAFDGNRSRLSAGWDGQPAGRSVFWIGRTLAQEPATASTPCAAATVVGDGTPSFRVQAGHAGDGLELVTADVLGDWTAGHFAAGAGVSDDAVHVVGFVQRADGAVTAWRDGVEVGAATLAYDAPWVGWDTLGAGYAGQCPYRGVLGAVLVVPGELDPADVARFTTFGRKFSE